jgi:hypothetical protein
MNLKKNIKQLEQTIAYSKLTELTELYRNSQAFMLI